MRILVVGASGFIGRNFVNLMQDDEAAAVTAVSRQLQAGFRPSVRQLQLPRHFGELSGEDLDKMFDGVSCVYHLAAATPHTLAKGNDRDRQDALTANVDMPLFFARAAKKRGVGRFIYVSSCGVYGAISKSLPFSEQSPFDPHDSYTASKIGAEKLLASSAGDCPDLTIVRPPSVYGPGGNDALSRLIQLTLKGVPLPLGLAKANRRRFIGVRNLTLFLHHVSLHPQGANNDFLVCDNETVSTKELISLVMQASGKKNWILPVPLSFMIAVANLTGMRRPVERILGNYEIDDRKARNLLKWQPPYSMLEELQYTVGNSK